MKIKSYHWNKFEKKKKDYKYLSQVYEDFLKSLSKKLNDYHNISRDLKYWRIIIGPWLNSYISSSFDRWEQSSDQRKTKKKLIKYKNENDLLINLDFDDYYEKITNSENYNQKIYNDISNFKLSRNLRFSNFEKNKISTRKKSFINQIYGFLINKIQVIFFNYLVYKKKNIFFSSYFSKKAIFYFFRKFRKNSNFLFYYHFENLCETKDFSYGERSKISLNINSKNLFETYLKEKIFKEIPIIYLEKFKLVRKMLNYKDIKKVNIISSIEHIFDDVIKIWIAEKIFNGSKFFIYDHSNSLRLLMNDFEHERKISDKIITCFNYQNKNFLNLPELKFSINKKNKNLNFNNQNELQILLYEGPKFPGKLTSCPSGETNYIQLAHTLKFYSGLKIKIKKYIKFKSPPYSRSRLNTFDHIKKKFGAKKLYSISSNFSETINHSKLIICTYPQTTLIETLVSERPFIILLPKKYWKFNKKNEEFLKKLKKNNILFYDPKKASNYVNKIWDNLDLWWSSKNIKLLRNSIKNKNFNFKLNQGNQWNTFFKKL